MVKDQLVSIRVNKNFFDNIFEPARKKQEVKMGIRISQSKFTKFLDKSKAEFKLPKQKIKKIKVRRPIKKGFSLI